MPLGRFHNLVWYWWTKDADPTDVAKFEAKLWRPPPGKVAQGPWSAEAETAAFAGLRAALAK